VKIPAKPKAAKTRQRWSNQAEQYIAQLPNIGESQRRHFRGFFRVILHRLARNRQLQVPAPHDLVKLKPLFKGGSTRQFSALGSFAKFLRSSNRWGDEDLTQFAYLMGRAHGRGAIARYVMPALDCEIEGAAFRRIRNIIGWKLSGASSILGISPHELQRIESDNSTFPETVKVAMADVVQLARRIPAEPPSWIKAWNRFSTTPAHSLPFSIPPCPGCGSNPSIAGRDETRLRGVYWSFLCRGCGGKYWSRDGILQLVNPGRGWRRKIVDRPTCPHCQVECVVTGSPGSSMKQHYFRCPKCERHYRLKGGKLVLTTPFVGPRVELDFLPDRGCPNCKNGSLRIRLRPPRTKEYLFNCRGDGSCRRSFKWNAKLKKLVMLEPRKLNRRPKRSPGRPTEPEDQKTYFKLGQQVEDQIPEQRKQHKHSIVTARGLVSERTGLAYDLIAQYHKGFRQTIKSNASLRP
jgi:hypothetical protein